MLPRKLTYLPWKSAAHAAAYSGANHCKLLSEPTLHTHPIFPLFLNIKSKVRKKLGGAVFGMTIGQREVINYETCIIRASQSSSRQNEVGKTKANRDTAISHPQHFAVGCHDAQHWCVSAAEAAAWGRQDKRVYGPPSS